MDDPFNTVSQQQRADEETDGGSGMKGESSNDDTTLETGLRRFRIGRKISNYIFSTSPENITLSLITSLFSEITLCI